MSVAHDPAELDRILERARTVSSDHPVVVTKFETGAREIEIDAIADDGEMVLWAICEHVEDAGVHSGDATLMLPPQTIPLPIIHRARKIAVQLAESLKITGPFNLQLLVKHGRVRVIEVNLRASRSLPFVSKVTGTNFVREAMRRMLGVQESGGEQGPRPRLRRREGAAVQFPATGGSRPDPGCRDGKHGRGGMLRRRRR